MQFLRFSVPTLLFSIPMGCRPKDTKQNNNAKKNFAYYLSSLNEITHVHNQIDILM